MARDNICQAGIGLDLHLLNRHAVITMLQKKDLPKAGFTIMLTIIQ